MLTAVKPYWFPDWSEEACAIVATGQSVKKANIDRLRGRLKIIAIKEAAIDICPWADVAYGCDAPWWIHRKGLPDFKGLKVCWEKRVPTQFPDVHLIKIKQVGDHDKAPYVDSVLTDQPGVIGGGKNSGFQAANLAVQFGTDRILLVGFDLSGEHYYGKNNWFKAGNPDRSVFEKCIKTWNGNADTFRRLGVRVVNASIQSALNCFPKHSIEDTLEIWGL